MGFVLERILKFNPEFQEFTDVDGGVEIRNLDRFQVHFVEAPHCHPVAREVCLTQVRFNVLYLLVMFTSFQMELVKIRAFFKLCS